MAKNPVLDFDRQLINVLSVEIVANVVVAGTVVPCQVSRKGGKDAPGRKLQESAIGDGVHAPTPCVVDLPHQAVADSLRGGHLQPVVMAARTSGKLRNRPK